MPLPGLSTDFRNVQLCVGPILVAVSDDILSEPLWSDMGSREPQKVY